MEKSRQEEDPGREDEDDARGEPRRGPEPPAPRRPDERSLAAQKSTPIRV